MINILKQYIKLLIILILSGCSFDCIDPGETMDTKKATATVYPINIEILSTAGYPKQGATNKEASNIKKLWYAPKYTQDGDNVDLILYSGLKAKIAISGQVLLKGFNDKISISSSKIYYKGSNFIPGQMLGRSLTPGRTVNISTGPLKDGYFKVKKQLKSGPAYNMELKNGSGLGIEAYDAGNLKIRNMSIYSNPETWACNTGVNGEQYDEKWVTGFTESAAKVGAQASMSSSSFDNANKTPAHRNIHYGLCDPDYETQPCDALGYTCNNTWINAQVTGDTNSDSDGNTSCLAYTRTGLFAGFDVGVAKSKQKNPNTAEIKKDSEVDESKIWPAEFYKKNLAGVSVPVIGSFINALSDLSGFTQEKPFLYRHPLTRNINFARCYPKWDTPNWMAVNSNFEKFTIDDTSISGFYLTKATCSQVYNEFSMSDIGATYGGIINFGISPKTNIKDASSATSICPHPSFKSRYKRQIFLARPIHNDLEYSRGSCNIETQINGSNSSVSLNYNLSGSQPETTRKSYRWAKLYPKWEGISDIVDKNSDVRISSNSNSSFKASMLENSDRSCGIATAFRVLPIQGRACLTGYKRICNNQKINEYIKTSLSKITDTTIDKEAKENDLLDKYCKQDSKIGSCISETKLKNTASGVFKILKFNTRYLNNFSDVDISSPWTPELETQSNMCGVCLKTIIDPTGVKKYSIQERMEEPKALLLDSDEKCQSMGYIWAKEYTDTNDKTTTFSFLENEIITTCKDFLEDPNITKSSQYSPTDNRLLNIKPMVPYIQNSKTGEGDLFGVSKLRIPFQDEDKKTLSSVNLFFYVAGELQTDRYDAKDLSKTSPNTVLTQHSDFRPIESEKDNYQKEEGYEVSIWTGEYLNNGTGMYMYIQPYDVSQKKLIDSQAPQVIFANTTLKDLIKDPRLKKIEDIVGKNNAASDFIEYIPTQTGKPWFIIPDVITEGDYSIKIEESLDKQNLEEFEKQQIAKKQGYISDPRDIPAGYASSANLNIMYIYKKNTYIEPKLNFTYMLSDSSTKRYTLKEEDIDVTFDRSYRVPVFIKFDGSDDDRFACLDINYEAFNILNWRVGNEDGDENLVPSENYKIFDKATLYHNMNDILYYKYESYPIYKTETVNDPYTKFQAIQTQTLHETRNDFTYRGKAKIKFRQPSNWRRNTKATCSGSCGSGELFNTGSAEYHAYVYKDRLYIPLKEVVIDNGNITHGTVPVSEATTSSQTTKSTKVYLNCNIQNNLTSTDYIKNQGLYVNENFKFDYPTTNSYNVTETLNLRTKCSEDTNKVERCGHYDTLKDVRFTTEVQKNYYSIIRSHPEYNVTRTTTYDDASCTEIDKPESIPDNTPINCIDLYKTTTEKSEWVEELNFQNSTFFTLDDNCNLSENLQTAPLTRRNIVEKKQLNPYIYKKVCFYKKNGVFNTGVDQIADDQDTINLKNSVNQKVIYSDQDPYRDEEYLTLTTGTEVNEYGSNIDYYNIGHYRVEIKAKQPKGEDFFLYNIVDYLLVGSIKDIMFGQFNDDGTRDWTSGFIYKFTTLLTANVYFQGLFYLGVVILVITYAFKILTGGGAVPDIKTLSKEFFRIGIIITLIGPNSWNFYQKYAVEMFVNIGEDLSLAFVGSLGETIPNNAGMVSDGLKKVKSIANTAKNVGSTSLSGGLSGSASGALDTIQNGASTAIDTAESIIENIRSKGVFAAGDALKYVGKFLGTQNQPGAFKPLDDVLAFLFSRETLIRLMSLMSSIPGLVTLACLITSFLTFLSASIRAVLSYVACILTICMQAALGPIFIVISIFEKSKDSINTWWKSLMSATLEQGMTFISVYVFGTLYLNTLKNILVFGVCMEPILTIPIINLTIISWWTPQGTVPNIMKNYMPEYKAFNFSEVSLQQAAVLLLFSLCFSKIIKLLNGLSGGSSSKQFGFDKIADGIDKSLQLDTIIDSVTKSKKSEQKNSDEKQKSQKTDSIRNDKEIKSPNTKGGGSGSKGGGSSGGSTPRAR